MGHPAGHNSLGTLERKAGEVTTAIHEYEKSLVCLDQLGDKLRVAQVYNNLGACYAELSNWSVSKEMYQKSLDLKKEAGDTIGLARTLANLIPVYQNLGALDDAIAAAQQATLIFEEMRDRYSAAVAMRNLAKLHRKIEEKEKAKDEYARAIHLFHEAGDDEQAGATEAELEAYVLPRRIPWWMYLPHCGTGGGGGGLFRDTLLRRECTLRFALGHAPGVAHPLVSTLAFRVASYFPVQNSASREANSLYKRRFLESETASFGLLVP